MADGCSRGVKETIICGLAGIALTEADARTTDVARLVAVMGKEIEPRGGHATGICTVSATKHIRVTKEPTYASKFFKERKGIGQSARIAMIHTRLATQGSQANNLNNHPVMSGNIIGCHNGIFDNDHELFRKNDWPRAGQVDSEAMFAAIHHTDDHLKAYEMMEGYAAVSWIDVRAPHVLHLARLSSSPLLYTRTAGGSLLYGSTQETILGKHIDKLIGRGDPYELFSLDEGQEVIFDLNTGELWVNTFTPINSWVDNYRSYLSTQGSTRQLPQTRRWNNNSDDLLDWKRDNDRTLKDRSMISMDDLDDAEWWDSTAGDREDDPFLGLYVNQRVGLESGVQGVILHIDRKNGTVDFLPFSNPVEIDAFDVTPVDPPRDDGQPKLTAAKELTTGGKT